MTTQPEPTAGLVNQLADVIAESADDHGAHDHLGQAADVLAWLDRTGLLYPNADPWFTRHADGRVEAHWPDGVQRALVARELVDQMATHPATDEVMRRLMTETIDGLKATLTTVSQERDQLHGRLCAALDLLPTTCRYHGENIHHERVPGVDGPCCDTGRTAWVAERIAQATSR